ncbi:Asp23/Gls24 family envelope stress response protein [Streptosporangium sp. NPDC023615]|uniref:Asp23/Gls24 family envelope stress response protein n=1 Tax=Streptosporangium sp. NPDC023615 TaxID=3154794 RepID=UPI003418B7B8
MSTPVEHRSAPGPVNSPPGAPGGPSGALPGGVPEQAGPYAPAAASGRAAVPPETRGRTDISDRVVSRIATRAAGEVARVRKVGERGPLSLRGGTRATVDGELTTLRLDVTVDYPAPLREVAQEVRSHVAERIMALTGLYVGHIDIDVVNVTLTGTRTTRTGGTPGGTGDTAGTADTGDTGDTGGNGSTGTVGGAGTAEGAAPQRELG